MNKLTENLNIIQNLSNQPTENAEELKRAFDEAGNIIKNYLNEVVEPAVSGIESDYVNSGALLEFEKEIDTVMEDLQNAVNKQLENFQNTLNTTVSSLSGNVDKKVVYGDIVIEAHYVSWGGGQVYQGHSQTDATSTITKSGYYPIGVCSINTLSKDKDYRLTGQSKTNGAITVNYRWYHDTNHSIAPGDMPSSMIFVAWVRIR